MENFFHINRLNLMFQKPPKKIAVSTREIFNQLGPVSCDFFDFTEAIKYNLNKYKQQKNNYRGQLSPCGSPHGLGRLYNSFFIYEGLFQNG